MSQTHVEESARRTPVIAEADVIVVGGRRRRSGGRNEARPERVETREDS
jgi:hypothetical protein